MKLHLCLNYLKRLVYLNHYYQTSLKKLVEHIQIYMNFMLDRINEFKGRVQIIDGTLKSYNSVWSNFFSMIKKRQVKGSKDFTLLYTWWLIYQMSQFIIDHTKEICWIRLFLRTFWKIAYIWGNISSDKALELKQLQTFRTE